jgi:alpha-1,3-rhamnosyl/mannosyltransferase
VHDVAFEIVPDAYPPGLLRYLRTVVPINVHRAARVAVVSRTTRIDVIERYKLPAERVVVIPNAADQRFFDAEPLPDILHAELGIPADYLLTVGTIEPRKNYRTLLEAQRLTFPSTGRPLVVVGRSGWHNQAEMRLIDELTRTGAVIPLVNAPDDILPPLYAGAHALAYVPLYEGFGLPVLEAMAAGTSVVASDIPSIREIAAGRSTVVQASNVESVAAGLRDVQRATSNEAAALREAARTYSWDQSGTILVDTIAEVMEAT